jgi:hypothetical protein
VGNIDLTLLGPLSPIIGAVIGAVIASLVTYFIVVRRQYLMFWILKSNDIAFPLRQQAMLLRQFFSIKIGDREFHNLNKSTVRVKNIGNIAIQHLSFDVVIPGEHTAVAVASARNLDLRRSVQVESKYDDIKIPIDPMYAISTSYLNPKESFEIALFFDGKVDECEVYCRMEDVKIKIRRGGTLVEQIFDDRVPTSIGAKFVRYLLFAPLTAPLLSRRRPTAPRRRRRGWVPW